MRLSQARLATKINELEGELPDNLSVSINETRIGRIERDEVEPMYSEICALSYVLDISVQCLMMNECDIEQDSTAKEIERLCQDMSRSRKKQFLQFMAMTAEFSHGLRCE